jgi:predicted AlkP superfamily phosphohydrolase/phosphomutase
VLKKPVDNVEPLNEDNVDWEKTVAWGWGGYYARVFLNVKGREAQGTVDPKDYEKTRRMVSDRIKAIRGPAGEKWDTRVYTPEELYPESKGDMPDLMVYFDDLYWRSAGSIGHKSLYLPENDTGPDDCVHAKEGMYILYDPKNPAGGKKVDARIYDVVPTILAAMELPVPKEMRGKPLS